MHGSSLGEWGLIVTADDCGICLERDLGIIEAFQNGIVTSASLIVTGSSCTSAAKQASDAGLKLGLHLNLTEGPPASSQDSVPSLLTHEKVLGNWTGSWASEGVGAGERLQFRGKYGLRKAAER